MQSPKLKKNNLSLKNFDLERVSKTLQLKTNKKKVIILNKYLEYEISKDFNNSDKAIYSRCFKFIHQEIYINPRIDIDFLKKIIITNKKIISLSFYWIRGSYEATWSASFGYDRQENY